MEIERKFLLTSFPDATPAAQIKVWQGYLSINPEVRIRRVENPATGKDSFFLTVKSDGNLAIEEYEIGISQSVYVELLAKVNGPLISKEMRFYDVDGRHIECSLVDGGSSTSFMYGEVEFPFVEEAEAFVWPFGDAEDVTYVNSFKMKNYWKRTRQKKA